MPHAEQGDRHVVVQGLAYRYPRNSVPTLSEVAMSVGRGEIAAIVGASGSGKSTLLHILAGLTPAGGGRVTVDGETVTGPCPSRILMLQEAALYPWMTALENAAVGLRFAGYRKAERQARAQETLRLVQLGEYAGTNVQHLSGGQQQRVALARALAPEPELLLLDEPFSSLDPFTRAALQRDVRAIVRQLGLTAVIVTHDIDEALVMADRVFVMASDPGSIVGSISTSLGDGRNRSDLAYRQSRQALVQLYESAIGQNAEGEDAQPLAARRALSA
jgi:NitT/TauT family transport system ATP-binding protein